jgi:hypothetical protein
MTMWLRLAGALLVTLAVLGCLDHWGVNSLVGGRSEDVAPAAHGRPREIFWFMIFAIVMATALLAAARRWTTPAAPVRLRRPTPPRS